MLNLKIAIQLTQVSKPGVARHVYKNRERFFEQLSANNLIFKVISEWCRKCPR